MTPADAPAVVAAMADWEVVRWLTLVPWPYRMEDADGWIAGVGAGHWAIDAGEGLIGVISIKPDMGYWLARPAHGRGYMTEAARAVVADYFRTTSEPLVSGHYPDNATSRAVLTKLGFSDTHVEMQHQVSTGREVPCQRMVLMRAAFRG